MVVIFGGLDLAKRSDHSALIVLKLENNVLEHYSEKLWDHVDYSQVAEDLARYHQKLKFNRIGFDRTGVGDAVSELFKNKNLYVPIVTSNPKKIEMINLMQSLFQQDKLRILKGGELEKQISEQTWDITDAGNLVYKHPTRGHDDLFWALGYACYVAAPALLGMVRPRMKFSEPDYRNLDDMIEDDMERMMQTV